MRRTCPRRRVEPRLRVGLGQWREPARQPREGRASTCRSWGTPSLSLVRSSRVRRLRPSTMRFPSNSAPGTMIVKMPWLVALRPDMKKCLTTAPGPSACLVLAVSHRDNLNDAMNDVVVVVVVVDVVVALEALSVWQLSTVPTLARRARILGRLCRSEAATARRHPLRVGWTLCVAVAAGDGGAVVAGSSWLVGGGGDDDGRSARGRRNPRRSSTGGEE
jgi:hypothetical protein